MRWMPPQLLRIVTRQSPLALWQAEFVRERLRLVHPGLEIELIGVHTQGDRVLHTPLAVIGGKGLFIKELENCLLEGSADIAVHSLKDLTVDLPAGLVLPVILEREDPRDALLSDTWESLEALPAGARVGTSSLRRQCQLRAHRPDLQVCDLRGNVGTRLERLERGDFDAIILAAAGLQRLGLAGRIQARLDPQQMLPAIGQGAIGIECRTDDRAVLRLIEPLDHRDTHVRALAERALNRRLGGGCQVPIAGYAELRGEHLHIRALVGRIDGSEIIRGRIGGAAHEAEQLGQQLAEDLLGRGAAEILQALTGSTSRSPRPLAGLGVLVTRPAHQAQGLCRLIEAAGGRPILWPVLEIADPEDPGPAQAVVDRLAEFDIAVFVSPNAAERGLQLVRERGQSLSPLAVVAAGPGTAKRLRVDGGIDPIAPQGRCDTEGMLALPLLQHEQVRDRSIVIFRGTGGRELLAETLRERGARIEYAEVYRRLRTRVDPNTLIAQWDQGQIDAVIATSSEGLHSLVDSLAEDDRTRLLATPLLVMSERSAALARRLGFTGRPVVAKDASDAGLIEALRWWRVSQSSPASPGADTPGGEQTQREFIMIEQILSETSRKPDDTPPEGSDATVASAPEPATPQEAVPEGPSEATGIEEAPPGGSDLPTQVPAAAPAAEQAPSPETAPPAEPLQARSGVSRLPALCLVLLALSVGLGVFWWLAEYRPSAHEAQARMQTLAAQLEELRSRTSALEGLRGQVAQIEGLKEQIGALSERDTQLDTNLGTLQTGQQDLSESLSHLALRTPQGAEDWILAEVEYLLVAADQRLRLEQDLKTALLALHAADARLRDLGRPDLKPVREQLIGDMNELHAIAPVDVTGLSLYLADLIARVDKLPFKGGELVEQPSRVKELPEISIGNWRDLVRAIEQDLTRLLSVTEQQVRDPALFDPEFRYYLQQHLRLELAGARLDVLHRNSANLRASIGIITDLLSRYYDTEQQPVAQVLATLGQMQQQELDPALPSLDQTLEALRQYVARRQLSGDSPRSGAAAAPPAEAKDEGAHPSEEPQSEHPTPETPLAEPPEAHGDSRKQP